MSGTLGKWFYVDGVRFHYYPADIDGKCWLHSIHPYDETEYHYAYRLGKKWFIIRNGKRVAVMDGFTPEAAFTPEEVASELLRRDKALNLLRTGGIW